MAAREPPLVATEPPGCALGCERKIALTRKNSCGGASAATSWGFAAAVNWDGAASPPISTDEEDAYVVVASGMSVRKAATTPSAAPSAREPTSPINICAG